MTIKEKEHGMFHEIEEWNKRYGVTSIGSTIGPVFANSMDYVLGKGTLTDSSLPDPSRAAAALGQPPATPA